MYNNNMHSIEKYKKMFQMMFMMNQKLQHPVPNLN